MTPKIAKRFSVTIDRKNSEELIVRAQNQTDAKAKAWKKFSKRKPKKKDHQIFCDEIWTFRGV